MYARPFYEHYAYEDYFVDHDFSSNIFGFLRDTGEVLSVFGGDVNWRQMRNMDLGVTVKSYSYDLR